MDEQNYPDQSGPSRRDVFRMFDSIAGRYDLLNHLLSFGQDFLWRRKLAASIGSGENLDILDLATGTADVVLATLRQRDNVASAVGLDMSSKMLQRAAEKIGSLGYDSKVTLLRGDAMSLPFADESFDAVTIAFGIRNLPNTEQALGEMLRVLKPGGRVLILEFSLPANNLIKAFHLFYLRSIVPIVGGIVSGNADAYRYLNETIESYPHGNQFLQLMEGTGFGNTHAHPLTMGVASLYKGIRIKK